MNMSKLEKITQSKKTILGVWSAAFILAFTTIGIKTNMAIAEHTFENLKSTYIQTDIKLLTDWVGYCGRLLDDSEKYWFIPFYIAYQDGVRDAYKKPGLPDFPKDDITYY